MICEVHEKEDDHGWLEKKTDGDTFSLTILSISMPAEAADMALQDTVSSEKTAGDAVEIGLTDDDIDTENPELEDNPADDNDQETPDLRGDDTEPKDQQILKNEVVDKNVQDISDVEDEEISDEFDIVATDQIACDGYSEDEWPEPAMDWYTHYEYEIENGVLWLTKAKAGEVGGNITIPGSVTIDGKEYRVGIGESYRETNAYGRRVSIWFPVKDDLTGIRILPGVAAGQDCSYMFGKLPRVTTIDASGLDTSEATNMFSMFYGVDDSGNLSQLKNLNITGFQTSKVESFQGMFGGCCSLKELHLEDIDTSNAKSLSYMFYACAELTVLDLSGFDTKRVQNMSGMFKDCLKLNTLDISSFNTSNVTGMSAMFEGCRSITSLELDHFDTSKVVYMSNMFSGCDKLATLDLGNFNTSRVEGMVQMFAGMTSLRTLDLRSFDFTAVNNKPDETASGSGVLSYSYTYGPCEDFIGSKWIAEFQQGELYGGVKKLYLPLNAMKNLDFTRDSEEEHIKDQAYYHHDAELTDVYYAGTQVQWENLGNTLPEGVALHCEEWAEPEEEWYKNYEYTIKNGVLWLEKAKEGKVSGNITIPGSVTIDGSTYQVGVRNCYEENDPYVEGAVQKRSIWYPVTRELTGIRIQSGVTAGTSCFHMFADLWKVTTIDLKGLDTSQVTTMDSMFYQSRSLKTLDLGNVDTSKVRSMSFMFAECADLQSVDVSGFNTENVAVMMCMFYRCGSLTELDLKTFNTQRVANMQGMFAGCDKLAELDVSSFCISTVSNMNSMFSGTSSLKTLNLQNFDFSAINALPAVDAYYGNERLGNLIGADWTCKVEYDEEYGFITGERIDLPGGVEKLYLPLNAMKGVDFTSDENGDHDAALTDVYYVGTEAQWTALENVLPEGVTLHCEEVKPEAARVSIFNGTDDVTDRSIDLDAENALRKTVTLKASVEGKSGDEYYTEGISQAVRWTSANEKVAQVKPNGTVTAVGNGSTKITAFAVGGTEIKASVTINVKTAVQKIEISEAGHELAKGKKLTLKATLTPAAPSVRTITWHSGDESILTVNASGSVTAVNTGTTTIVARATDGSGVESEPYEITVTSVSEQVRIKNAGEIVTGRTIGLDPDSKTMSEIVLTAEPVAKKNGEYSTDGVSQTVTWKSSNTKIATVDADGRVRALEAGTAQIIATAADGSGKSAKITINSANLVREITIRGEQEAAAGKSVTLSATVVPDSAKNKAVDWSVSNPGLAAVSNGKVTVKNGATGTFSVTASAKDGSGTASEPFVIKIMKPAETVRVMCGDQNITNGTIGLDPDEDDELQLSSESLANSNGTLTTDGVSQDVTWKSSNLKVATVDASGLVTILGTGSSVITATAGDGSGKSGKTTVNVARLVKEITITGEDAVAAGKSTTLTPVIVPDSAANKALLWSVDPADAAKATVSNGKVSIKPNAAGSVKVIATAKDGSGISASHTLSIMSPVLSVQIRHNGQDVTKKTIEPDLSEESQVELTAVCAGNAASQSVTWKSSNLKVATVENGVVTLLSAGSATITATAADGSGKNATVTIKVKQSEITLAGPGEVAAGKSVKLIAQGPAVTWEIVSPVVSNRKEISINASGMLTVKSEVAAGTGITVKATEKTGTGEKKTKTKTVIVTKQSAKVLIKKGTDDVTGRTVGVDRDNLASVDLSAEVADAQGQTDGVSQFVEWKTSNAKIATVDKDGKVTPVAAGTATITATTLDGMNKSAKITLNVASLTTGVQLSAAGNAVNVAQGKSLQFTASAAPFRTANKAFDWRMETDYSGVVLAEFDPDKLPKNAISVSNKGKLLVNAQVPAGTRISVSAAATDGSGTESAAYEVTVTKAAAFVAVFVKGDSHTSGTLMNSRKLGMERDQIGGTVYLEAVCADAAGQITAGADISQEVVWSSSNPKVAVVDPDGKVTSVGAGTAQIKATTADGSAKSATVTINVASLVTGLNIIGPSGILGGQASTESYSVEVLPRRAADKKVTWSVAYDLPNGSSVSLKAADVKISNGKLSISRLVPVDTRITITAATMDGSRITEDKVVIVK